MSTGCRWGLQLVCVHETPAVLFCEFIWYVWYVLNYNSRSSRGSASKYVRRHACRIHKEILGLVLRAGASSHGSINRDAVLQNFYIESSSFAISIIIHHAHVHMIDTLVRRTLE